jgi:hypothetical protein
MVYLIGLAIIGFTLQWTFVIIGIVIASVGEFIVAPGYMAFVSKLATKEKVSAYVGCNFISYMVGLLGGTFVFSLVVNYVGIELQMPHFFYGILLSFGLGLLIIFIIYYWTWGQDIIERAKRIKALEEGEEKEPAVPSDYKEPALFRIFDSKLSVIVCLILIPIILFSTYGMGTLTFYPPEEEEDEAPGFNPDDYLMNDGPTFESGGMLQEGQSIIEAITIDAGEGGLLEEGELMRSITFELTWEDEADYQPAFQPWPNQPDEFMMSVSESGNYSERESGANTYGGPGLISITIDFVHDFIDSRNGTGEWGIEITLIFCGDHENPTFPVSQPDDSNTYALMITSEVYSPI